MTTLLSFLQSVYFAWVIAVIAILVVVIEYNFFFFFFNAIEDDTKTRIKETIDHANETIRQNRTQCDAEIEHERIIYNEKIRLLQEQIDADKASIMKKTEKEILADLTVSLNGFARRIDRVEKNLVNINHEMELIVDKVDNIGITVSDAQFHL